MLEINKILIGLCISLIFLSGCYDGIVLLNATSSGDCVIQCKNLTQNFNYHCMEAYANCGTIIENGKLLENSCECVLLDCFKEIK